MGNNLDIFELPKIKNSDKCTACNTGFASGGLTCKVGAMCIYSSSALVDSFVLRNPPERKARKRYTQANESRSLTREVF